MKRILLLSSILLLSAIWAIAQSSNPDTSNSNQTSPYSSSSTVEGCLSGSEGSYTLTASSGVAYHLTGKTDDMQAHVGHTIQVTGSVASPTSSAPDMSGKQSGSMSAPAQTPQEFHVASFKHRSTTCGNTQ